MREISNLAREDNRVLTTLAKGSRKDSKVMKSVSVLATLYLPASLIAVSTLKIPRHKGSADNQEVHL
jgi:hypothetical protein